MINKIKIILIAALVAVGTLFQSCETTELELTNSPNNLTSGDPVFLLNNIQIQYRNSQVTFNNRSSELTRIDYMFGRVYFSNYGANTMNGPWGDLYSDILPDVKELENLESEDRDLGFNIAISRIMQAHLMMQLVDFIGNIVPMEFATQPTEFPTPELSTDGGESSYAEAIQILNEAISVLNNDPPTTSASDLYYGGDTSKWIKVANTLKMRAALTTGDYSTFNSLVNAGNFISSTDDDFQWQYGTQIAPVNTQHQDYQVDYTTSGAGIYYSNWLMNTMLVNNDPRTRYYFYRQSECTPGASCNPAGNGETLQCSLQAIPTHLQGTPCGDIWCYMEGGYWGRAHGNDEGTPPDNFTRTAAGVYPAAGKFDDDDFSGVSDFTTNPDAAGGQGAGIEPIILASYVDFWRAEVALVQGQNGTAAGHMENGLRKSIAKVQSFIGLDPNADSDFAPSEGDIDAFVASKLVDFNDSPWETLGEQYFVTMYGGGADAHNFYRRTGFPTSVCPSLEPDPGPYPRTFLYPASEASVNGNITQRTDNNEPVFWNTQPLPPSN